MLFATRAVRSGRESISPLVKESIDSLSDNESEPEELEVWFEIPHNKRVTSKNEGENDSHGGDRRDLDVEDRSSFSSIKMIILVEGILSLGEIQ